MIPDRPKPPIGRIINLSIRGSCESCGSSVKRNWFGLGKVLGCIHPECDHYYRSSDVGRHIKWPRY